MFGLIVRYPVHRPAVTPVPQRRLIAFQVIQLGVEALQRLVFPVDLVLFKKLESPVETGLLSGVHQWYTRDGVVEHGEGLHAGAQALVFRAVPGVFIVVSDELHGVSAFRVGGIHLVELVKHGGRRFFTFSDSVHHVVEGPFVIGVEGIVEQGEFVGVFCQHPDIGLGEAKRMGGLLPKVDRHLSGHIASEPVDIGLCQPEAHLLDHGFAEVVHVVVELGHVGPVEGCYGGSLIVHHIPVRMGLYPRMVAGGVVGHPVDDNLHVHPVGALHHPLKVVHSAKLRIDPPVVCDRVIGSKRAFALHDPDGVYGHEPQDIDAHIPQSGQVRAKSVEGALRGILSDIHLVDAGVSGPIGLGGLADGVDRLLGGRLCHQCDQAEQQGE